MSYATMHVFVLAYAASFVTYPVAVLLVAG